MGKEANRNAQKSELLTAVQEILSAKLNSDVLRVGTSELAFPAVDDEGNEFFFKVSISVPRGTRNGSGYDPYDGYAEAEAYRFEQEEKAVKKAKSEQKKADAAAQRERKKEAKQVKKAIQNLEKAVAAEGMVE